MKNPLQEQLDQLRSAQDQAISAAQALVTSEDYDPNDQTLKGLEERAEQLGGQIDRLVSLIEAQTAADALDGKLSKTQARAVEVREAAAHDTLGHAWVASDQFRDYRGRGKSEIFEWQDPEERALPHLLANFADALSLESNKVVDLTAPRLPMKWLPVITKIPVSTDNVDFVWFEKVAGGATVVAEGATKPSVEWTSHKDSDSLETIAAWTKFSRQLAADSAAIRAYMNGELTYEVAKRVEAEAAAVVTAEFAAADAITSPVGSGISGAVLRGKYYLTNEVGYAPNAFAVRESDWLEFELALAAATNTVPGERPGLAGLTAIQVDDAALAEGEVVVGAYDRAFAHFSRSGIDTFTTDSDGTDFQKNILTQLAECRVLTKTIRAGALVRVAAAAA